jgi:hypothetical protein
VVLTSLCILELYHHFYNTFSVYFRDISSLENASDAKLNKIMTSLYLGNEKDKIIKQLIK